jgi:hypothetical protein
MWKAHIKPGNEYALREKLKSQVQHVRILEHVRGNRWKAEWIDPNPGLVHYVESGQLIAPWKQLKAFLREEQEGNRIREHNKRIGFDEASPVTNALYQVFESCGENQVSFYKGILTGTADALDRVKARAGMVGRRILRTRTRIAPAQSTCRLMKQSRSLAGCVLPNLTRSFSTRRRPSDNGRETSDTARTIWPLCSTNIARRSR